MGTGGRVFIKATLPQDTWTWQKSVHYVVSEPCPLPKERGPGREDGQMNAVPVLLGTPYSIEWASGGPQECRGLKWPRDTQSRHDGQPVSAAETLQMSC